MANRTAKTAKSVHGQNPQFLVEMIIRSRIYESLYWKENCFALTAATLVERAAELDCVGGVHSGHIKPTPFLCLTLKLLQLQPEPEIILEYIKQEEFKYLRALGAYYLRLVGTAEDIYNTLEGLYTDYRRLRFLNRQGDHELLHMDEFVDMLLREERVCDVILPRIPHRYVLELADKLEPRVSRLEEMIHSSDEGDDSDADDTRDSEARGTDSEDDERSRRSMRGPLRDKSRQEVDEDED
eukprot:m.12650 g.12650  ORF g.12650 m.12650 type:complete len:240 (-) comp5844_c0_seq2:78-797(-)